MQGKQSCTSHVLSSLLFFSLLPVYLHPIILLSLPLSFTLLPSQSKALSQLGWPEAMQEEMLAMKHNEVWPFVPLPGGKRTDGCDGCEGDGFIK